MKIGRILTGLALGMFLAALDQTVVATSAPVIASTLGNASGLIWVITPYLFASLVTTPLYGRLSDTHGRRPLYLTALSLFLLGSIAVAIAPTLTTLALARGLQGLGAGGLLSLAFVIVADMIPLQERGKYLFVFIAVFGAASLLGPVFGGILADIDLLGGIAGWRWIFFFNIPVALIALALTTKHLHINNPRTERSFDVKGLVIFALLIATILVIIDFGYWGLVFVAAALLAYGIYVENRRGEDGLIPLPILTNPNYNALLLISFLGGAGFLGAIAAVPTVLQQQQEVSPFTSGLFLLAAGFGNLITTDLAGRALRKDSDTHDQLLIASLVLMTLAFLGLACWSDNTNKYILLASLIAIGSSFGLVTQIGSMIAPAGLGEANAGTASTLNTFIRALGGVIGSAAIAGPIASDAPAVWVFLLMAVFITVVSFTFLQEESSEKTMA